MVMPDSTGPSRLALLLAIGHGADAIACAIPLAVIERDLTRMGVPGSVQRAIPVVKAGATVGLVAGFRRPGVGKLTTKALVAYYSLAVLAHVRAGDHVVRHVPAAGMLAASAIASARCYED